MHIQLFLSKRDNSPSFVFLPNSVFAEYVFPRFHLWPITFSPNCVFAEFRFCQVRTVAFAAFAKTYICENIRNWHFPKYGEILESSICLKYTGILQYMWLRHGQKKLTGKLCGPRILSFTHKRTAGTISRSFSWISKTTASCFSCSGHC